MNFTRRFGAILLMIAAALVVYAPALRNGFVWDDTALVLRDPLVRSWRLIPEGFRHFLFLDATGSDFYRPLQRVTYVFDYACWGFDAPWGWHLTSVVVHVLAAVALYALLVEWLGTKRRGLALGVSLLWVIHPLYTSAVTYVAGRADLLAALCGLVALRAVLRDAAAEGGRSRGATVIGGLGLLGALLAKESGFIFLALALLALLLRRAKARCVWRWTAIVVAVLGVYLSLRLTAHRTPPPTPRASEPVNRSSAAVRALGEYAGLIVAPTTLRMDRDAASRGDAALGWRSVKLWTGVAVLVGLVGWAWWCWKRNVEAWAALVAATLCYLPISNLIPLNARVAEHWLYVPGAFFFTAVALTGESFRWSRPMRALVYGVLALWAVLLGVRTWTRQGDWKDQETFLTRTIEAGGDSARMRVNLGQFEFSRGKPEEALKQFAIARERDPELSFVYLGIAAVQMKLQRFEEAREALDVADRSVGLEVEKLQTRAALDFAQRGVDPVPALRAAAERTPWNWPARRKYLEALALTGRLRPAIEELRSFLEEQDFRADSWKLLADLTQQAGLPEASHAALSEARWRDVRLP